ncbi:MAG: putative transposase [Kiritimatiellia bacterium]
MLKANSSKWIHDTVPELASVAWQTGHAAFSMSKSQAGKVTDYIVNQKNHHMVKRFEDEYRAFLERHEVDYDEEYLLG